ncbi:MAG TPA: class I SAM-dependent methyltransferase [Patescibacteria group bacterium]|nr:class I SAM-dependent methyltransferase [Patescibacteria group bacterium]
MNDDLRRWDEEAEHWAKDSESKRLLARILINYALTQFEADFRNKKVLDAGCGEGTYTETIQNLGAEVIGLDGSPKMVEIAQNRRPKINFVVGDLLDRLDFPDKNFDTLTSLNVLMSLPSVDMFLSEASRLIKSDGSLIICVFHPALNEPTTKLYNTWWRRVRRKPAVGIVYSYFLRTNNRRDDFGVRPWPFYHRTIEEYSAYFRKHGFVIETIFEPHTIPAVVLQNHPKLKYATRIPRFIFFKLIQH